MSSTIQNGVARSESLLTPRKPTSTRRSAFLSSDAGSQSFIFKSNDADITIQQVGKDFFELNINKVTFDVIKAKELANVRSGKPATVVVENGKCYSLDHIKDKEVVPIVEYKPETFFGKKEEEKNVQNELARQAKEKRETYLKESAEIQTKSVSDYLFGPNSSRKEENERKDDIFEAQSKRVRMSNVITQNKAVSNDLDDLFTFEKKESGRRYTEEKFDIFDFDKTDISKSTPFD